MRLALLLRIPFSLEQPLTSKMWKVPELTSIAMHCLFVELDQCMFGTPWKKPTRFLCYGIEDVGRLTGPGRCKGKQGCCSRTGQRHVLLTGSGPNGRPLTSHASHFPKLLCTALAHSLTENRRAQIYNI